MLRRLFLCSLLSVSAAFAADLRLPAIISNHMVLQAGKETALWGWSAPDDKVTVKFVDPSGATKAEASATAGADRRWIVRLPELASGTSGRLQFTSAQGGEKTVEDVLVGEVWLGSGQSNMAMPVKGSTDLEGAMKAADDAKGQIRFFLTEKKWAATPQDDLVGQWTIATGETVGPCSAVAWNMARALHETLHVPVGLVISAYGGTPVQAWLSKETLVSTEASKLVWQWHQELLDSRPQQEEEYAIKLKAWNEANPSPEQKVRNANKRPKPPYSEDSPKAPIGLYNAMIAPLVPYTIKGLLWYQAEQNSKDPRGYGEMIQALVKSWRKEWNDELPFYYVELANFTAAQREPAEGNLALIREQQAEVLKLPRTGSATAIDVGDAKDIHPKDKATVGQRIGRMALHDVYDQKIEGPVRSPRFKDFAIKDGAVRLSFTDAQGLRSRLPNGVRGFGIRGADGKWVWADAKIEGEDIVVSSAAVPQPEAVCYAWASNPKISVENSAGLPLQPFRTDKPQ